MGVLHLNGAPLLFGGAALHFGTAETATLINNAITIRNRSISEMAPEAIVFAIDPATLNTPLGLSGPSGGEEYDPRLVEPTFVFTFGDSYAFTSSTNTAKMTSATALGPVAQHTYRSGGNYSVRVDIYMPGGGHWYSTLSVTVNSWAGTTITVGPTGRDYTSFDTALTNALGSESGQTEIVLDRAETFSFSGATLGATTGTRYNNLMIRAATGAGANPIVNWNGQLAISDSATALGDGAKDLIIQNIDAVGGYDSTAGTGTLTEFLHVLSPTASPNQILIDGGSAHGMDYGIYFDNPAGGDLATHIILNDTDWSDYAAALINAFKPSAIVATGSNIASHPAARVNTVAGNNAGWLLRCNTPLIVTNKNNFHCRQGWFNPATPDAFDYQNLRYNADGRAGAEIYISENYGECGFSMYNIGSTDSGDVLANKALVVESNITVGSFQTSGGMFSNKHGGAYIRNNLWVLPATTYQKNAPTTVYTFEGAGPSGNLSPPIRIYNDTVVNLRSDASLATLVSSFGSTFTDLGTPENMVVHEPNLGTPNTADAPLIDSGTALMQPVEIGYKNQSGTMVHGTDAETPQNIIYSFAPDTGSAAIDDATTGLVAPLDQTRAERGATPSRGWREPA